MTFGVPFQLYDSMINAGSPAFLAVSKGVNSTYEKSGLQCFFITVLGKIRRLTPSRINKQS